MSASARLRQAGRTVRFTGYFLRALAVANAQVVWDVVTPRSRLQPGVVALPLRCRTDAEVALLANLVTLTPGTLTLAISREPAVLYVHGMYAGDREAFRAQLAEMETRMLRAVRRDDDVPAAPRSARA
ncbi:MAG TPA: Na+/H+ antiporter subunit E [Mycobacteriales bacterium]|nr:Na+/H+ antiporter subunit E [Mycobacteriales bacterium]